MLWREFFMKIANNGENINNYCNNPYNKFQKYCQEWCLYNAMKTNTMTD